MAKQIIPPYFEKHRADLKLILDSYARRRAQTDLEGFEDPAWTHLTTLDTLFRNAFRPYQWEAISILHELFEVVQENRGPKRSTRRAHLIGDLVEQVEQKKIPYLGFEMATGSGKTLVMGASIALLAQRFGVKNFLVLVGGPASSNIYQKTIRNFTHGHPTCIWDSRDAFPFRLVTGENYRDAQGGLPWTREPDVNVFVFNIQKFTETSGQTGAKSMRTQKPWETAPWKDRHGNTISLHEFLRQERLVIITDEAHHTQGTASQNIIKGFNPEAVLEFTATADEAGGGNRRAQDIVYKYDIRQFLDDGYGKLIRALALESETATGSDNLDDYEKQKIITTLLVHLVKQQALSLDKASVIDKAVCLIKVKDVITAAQRVLDYVQSQLLQDSANLKAVLDRALGQQLEVLERFQEIWKAEFHESIDELIHALTPITSTAIGIFGEPTKETRAKFDNIARNDIQVVVYIKMLDEGIDLPHIYTMAVVNDNTTNLVTSIKQIIGRGVRLNKETRRYDGSADPWLTQAELLHVVCDRGAAFESVIAAIQSEFGLTDRHIVVEKSRQQKVVNRVKRHLLEDRFWPQLRADLVAREGLKLLDLMGELDTIRDDFIDANCFYRSEVADGPILKFRPSAFFVEVDLFADPAEYKRQMEAVGAQWAPLVLDDEDWKVIFGKTIRLQTTIPAITPFKQRFLEYQQMFTQEALGFFFLEEADKSQAKKLFIASFASFLANFIEKRYYRLDVGSLAEENYRPLVNCFREEDILLPQNIQELWARTSDASVVKDMVKNGSPFRGYQNNAYDYVSYDSFPEKAAGDQINRHLDEYLTVANARPVWIRNNRQVSLAYGRRQYFPDFLICVGDKTWILETKGDLYSDPRKNKLLFAMEEKTGSKVKSVLAFGDWVLRYGHDFGTLDDFLVAAEDDAQRRLQTWELEYVPPEDQKYLSYLPVYTPEQAWRRFFKNNEQQRPSGWAVVANTAGNRFAETTFAIQNRSPQHSQKGPWLVFQSGLPSGDNEHVLLKYQGLDEEYRRGYGVRQCRVTQESNGGLFTEEVWEFTGETNADTRRLRPSKDSYAVIATLV